MNRSVARALLAGLVLAAAPLAAAQTESAPSIPDVGLSPAFPLLSFTRPVLVTAAPKGCPDTDGRLFVLEQPGRIVSFPNDSKADRFDVALDLRDLVFDRHNEEGLLALAFHPKFAENRLLYVCHSANDPRRGVIARYRLAEGTPPTIDPASRAVILEVEQPWGNHNGCTLAFGSDGMLYASFGDGGAANDPKNAGQDLSTLLGKILRIDVDRPGDGRAYGIPADNPFVGRDGARGEIWAYGLRNVWRMSFDRETGELWAGDVGQNAWEEIDLVVKGGNYGWRIREGTHPFADGTPPDPWIEPVIEYGRREGISVTGGVVYRGARYPALRGVYLYADYGSRRLWGLRHADGAVVAHRLLVDAADGRHVSSFGEDADGEVFVCTFDQADARNGKGRVFRVVAR